MSSAFPTLQAYYSSNGTSWSSDLGPAGAGDVNEIKMTLREAVFGTGLTEITLNNLKGKYMASIFTPWPQETGLGYYWKWTINGIGPWYGRALDLTPNLSVKEETLKVSVGMMDDPLKNNYLTGVVAQDNVRNMITFGCQQWGIPAGVTFGSGNKFIMGGVTYTVDATTNGPGPIYPVPNGYDCARARIYAHDFIRDLLVTASDRTKNFYGWSGYVDSLQGPLSTTLYIFQQGAKTYGSNLIYGTNVSTIRNTRNIMRSKNLIEYVGSLSNSEPPAGPVGIPTDPWTEDVGLQYWTATQGSVSASGTHWCPVQNAEVYAPCITSPVNSAGSAVAGQVTIDTSSILGQSQGTSPVILDLNLQAALGETFNAMLRNATSLNFMYRLQGPILGQGTVRLKDANQTHIIATNSGLTPTSGPIRNNRFGNWNSFSAPTGPATQYITSFPGGTPTFQYQLFWSPLSANAPAFDWSNVTDIIFAVYGSLLGVVSVTLYIDHLYWAQSYQPTVAQPDVDAINQYGQRMQYYDASMYYTDTGLRGFAAANAPTMSPPAMQIDVVTSLGPEAEAGGKGFQPGFSFPKGAVQVSNYGYDKVAWRAIEVETDIKAGKQSQQTTRFILVPASTTGVGVDMAKFEPRKYWPS